MTRSDLAPGREYILTRDYKSASSNRTHAITGEIFVLETDDGTDRPRFKSVTADKNGYFNRWWIPLDHLTPVDKMKPTKKDCEVCKTPKQSGCRCGKYTKNAWFILPPRGKVTLQPKKMATTKTQKLHTGDRIINLGRPTPAGTRNDNAGKLGTVVDYDVLLDEYAIVYDDGETGAGPAKHYGLMPGVTPAPVMSTKSVEEAKELLHMKKLRHMMMILGGSAKAKSGATPKKKKASNTTPSHQFKLGDRVRVKANGFADVESLKGYIGTIRATEHPDDKSSGMESVGVEFDGWSNGHNLDGLLSGDAGDSGRWGSPEELELYIEKPKPVFKLNQEALDALVLDAETKKEIVAVLKQHENAGKLFDEWGLGSTIEYGRGMTMLFWGGPGTGKTWGAHSIAKALGQELLQISAAEIQSSEPGATERNLQEAFATAKSENKVLFIDECDSIITTRADLGMILAAQVNCLLTQIEKFEGVCILATNRIETMDEALERRLALIIEFPFPKYAQRIEIWRKLLPKKMPIAEGITPETLAQAKFTGGQIKNILLQAARLAVAESAPAVTQAHFDSAVVRLNKSKGIMGKVERSRTGRPRDGMEVGVGVGINSNPQVSRDVDIDTFLSSDEGEAEEEK